MGSAVGGIGAFATRCNPLLPEVSPRRDRPGENGWLFAVSEHVKSVVRQSLSAGFLSVSVDRLRVWARAVSWI
ncbi:hypothetical protein PJM29_15305, partial [Mycobacterium kansasii]